MLAKMKWIAIVLAVLMAVSACSSAKDPGAANDGEGEGTATEVPAEGADGTPPGGTPQEEGQGEPVEDQTAKFGVMTGGKEEITTMIEGMEEQVEVTQYLITPYSIQFHLRSLMGDPSVDGDQIVFKAPMGSGEATVTIEVREGMSVDQAAEEAKKTFAEGYELVHEADVSSEESAYQGKVASYQKDGYAHGFHALDVNGNAVVIFRSYPQEAGDGMAAILGELTKSVTGLK